MISHEKFLRVVRRDPYLYPDSSYVLEIVDGARRVPIIAFAARDLAEHFARRHAATHPMQFSRVIIACE